MRKFFTLSLILHLTLFGIFYYWGRQSTFLSPQETVLKPIEVEMVTMKKGGIETGSQVLDSGQRTKTQRKNQLSTPSKKLDLGLLAPKYNAERSTTKDSDSSSRSTKGEPDGYDVAQTIGTSEEANLYPFVRAVWQKIDSKVSYPNDFVKQRIDGNVTVHFVIDRRGVFTGKFIKVDADNSFLKVYILAILVHALKEPLRENLWSKYSQMTMVAHFQFSLFGSSQSPEKKEVQHFKNILVFERKSYAEPKVNEAIEKFFTRYFPPIIPIPGGFFIDFIRAYQFFASIGKPDPDDLREQRLSSMKDHWEAVIKEPQNEKK